MCYMKSAYIKKRFASPINNCLSLVLSKQALRQGFSAIFYLEGDSKKF